MAYYYAQLDEDNICIGLSQLSGEVDSPDMIELSEADFSGGNILGCRYENGEWIEIPHEPYVPEKTIEERLAEMEELQLIQMMAQAEIFEQQQEETLIMFSAMADLFEAVIGGE